MNARRTPSALSPFRSGGSLALLSALAFGVTTPLVQRFGKLAGPLLTHEHAHGPDLHHGHEHG